jgi:hypothetical protein
MHELHLHVDWQAPAGDPCAERQAARLLKDFRKLSHAERDRVRLRVPGYYSQLIVAPTQTITRVTGEVTWLALVGRGCLKGPCSERAIRSKVLLEQRGGVLPDLKTRVQTAQELLVITPLQIEDQSVRRTYITEDPTVYAALSDVSSPEFLESRQQGQVLLREEAAVPAVECAPWVRLSELIP